MRPIPIDDPAVPARLAALHRRCFDPGWTEHEISRMLHLRGVMGMMAEDDHGDLVAMALAHAVLDQADVLTICVHPRYRGQGVARQLMEGLETVLRAVGVATVYLEVRLSNASAKSLYEAMGYEAAGLRPNYYRTGESQEDGLLMKKSF